MSAVDLANDIKEKKVSPVEVMEETIDLIEKRNASLNAFVYTAFEDAREKAATAEKKLMAGEATGSFFGVPTAAKDFQPSIPGWPGTFGGVRAFKDMKDERYGLYAKSMLDEGAIFVGKTNSPSFAFSGICDNKLFGPTSTPFKPGHNSGGSSGGSAAAVSDGLVLVAHATDGGGSIRIPASWCGCYGYKASIGTISTAPRPDAWGLTYCHPREGSVSRTVKDAAYVLQAMAGYDTFDPNSVPLGDRDFPVALKGSLEGWKIAYTPDWGIFPVEEEVERIVEKAALAFEEAGATVEKIEPGFKRSAFELAELWCRVISISGMEDVEVLKGMGYDLLKDYSEDLPKEFVYWMSKTYQSSCLDFCKDQMMRTEVYEVLQSIFRDYDLIISPTTICLPVENSTSGITAVPKEINGVKVEPLIGWCETFFCNFTGNPAASVPAGLSESGLPVGMQIIGKKFRDEDVLTASAVFEELRPWKDTYNITEARPLA